MEVHVSGHLKTPLLTRDEARKERANKREENTMVDHVSRFHINQERRKIKMKTPVDR